MQYKSTYNSIFNQFDHYPFGMTMPGRSYIKAGGEYRFGFNGMEKDGEGMGGGGSTYDYGFRIYNPQLGKFLSVDPLSKSYSFFTPYQFAANSPISGVDLDGLEYFYAADGSFIGKIGTSTEVYLVNNNQNIKRIERMVVMASQKSEKAEVIADKLCNVSTSTSLNYSEFKTVVGTVYTEMDKSNYSMEEGAAMFDVFENRKQDIGGEATILDVVSQPNQFYGYSDVNPENPDEKMRETVGNVMDGNTGDYTDKIDYNSDKVQDAIAGVLKGSTTKNSEKDYSNGATSWIGRDIKTTFQYKGGLSFSQTGHNLYSVPTSTKEVNNYETTGASGGTMFIKRTSESIKRDYPYSAPNVPQSQKKNTW